MTKLSDTQLLILSAAAQRDGRIALPLPKSLPRGGAAAKVVGAMIAKGFLEEVEADLRKSDVPVWHKTGDGHGTTLVVTGAGLAAIGIESEVTDAPADAPAPDEAASAAKAVAPAETSPSATTGADTAPAARQPREGTKTTVLVDLLRRPEGASMADLTGATGWLPHTVRASIATTVRKKLGHDVQSEKPQGQDRRWRIAG